jgi:hypothetical protein
MKLVATALTSLVAVSNANIVQGECNDNGNLVLKIPYTVADSQVLSLQAGVCTEADTDRYSFSQDATHATLTIDIENCKLDANTYPVPAARALDYFAAGAKVELGKKNGAMVFSMYKATINTECGTETEYSAIYNYGEIFHQTDDDTLIEGTYSEFPFVINAYTDASYEHEVGGSGDDQNRSQDEGRRAGETVFLAIEPSSDFDADKYDFAVKECTFENTSQNRAASMFDYQSNNQCGNAFVDLQMSYVENVWRLQHKLFVFGDGNTSTYQLTCAIKLCEKDDNNSVCKDIYAACGF